MSRVTQSFVPRRVRHVFCFCLPLINIIYVAYAEGTVDYPHVVRTRIPINYIYYYRLYNIRVNIAAFYSNGRLNVP